MLLGSFVSRTSTRAIRACGSNSRLQIGSVKFPRFTHGVPFSAGFVLFAGGLSASLKRAGINPRALAPRLTSPRRESRLCVRLEINPPGLDPLVVFLSETVRGRCGRDIFVF